MKLGGVEIECYPDAEPEQSDIEPISDSDLHEFGESFK